MKCLPADTNTILHPRNDIILNIPYEREEVPISDNMFSLQNRSISSIPMCDFDTDFTEDDEETNSFDEIYPPYEPEFDFTSNDDLLRSFSLFSIDDDSENTTTFHTVCPETTIRYPSSNESTINDLHEMYPNISVPDESNPFYLIPSSTAPTSSTSRSALKKKKTSSDSNPNDIKKVSFGTLQIREYPVVLGDHPCCSNGPALSLGWVHTHELTKNIDTYERTRRSRTEMRLSPELRQMILLKQTNVYKERRSLLMNDFHCSPPLDKTTMFRKAG